MVRFSNEIKLTLLYFAILIITGAYIYPFWSIMLTVWATFYYIILWRKDEQVLNKKEIKLWKLTVFLYPLIETAIKAMIIFNVIPYSWRPLNLAEHFLWSLSMYLMLLPYTKSLYLKINNYWAFILIAGIVIIFGNLNELIEFTIRNYYSLTSQKLYAAYYLDTIIDLAINPYRSITWDGLICINFAEKGLGYIISHASYKLK